jgi:oligoendopeptidase F
MPIKTSWNLQKYFYQDLKDPKITQDLELLQTKVQEFKKKYETKINSLSTQELKQMLESDQEISLILNKLASYFLYVSSLDTQNQDVIKSQGELQMLLINLSNQLLFVSQEFKEMGSSRLLELSNNPELQPYSNYFYQKALNLKHILDHKTELALNYKENSGASVLINLYEELNGYFSFKFPKNLVIKTDLKIDQKDLENTDKDYIELTLEEVSSLRSDPQEEVRKASFDSINQVYTDKQNQITLSNIYLGIVKDWVADKKIRGFKDVMSARNISEEVPDQAVDKMIKVVTDNFPLYHRYLKARARFFGVEKIKRHNLFAPLSSTVKTFTLEQALKIVTTEVNKFDPEFKDFIEDMIDSQRVDFYPKKGKRSGAFASYSKGLESFVLLNFTNKIDDVLTIAHEFGHAYHGYLSQSQVEQVYDTPLCLAETASIFTETIVAESLLKELKTKQEKLYFIDLRLQDVFGTIFRQITYINFEREVHSIIDKEKNLTSKDLNRIWQEKNLEQYGEIVEIEKEISKNSGFLAIPHIFHTPFYCYAYTFGNILSFSLYQKYQKQGKDFVTDYKDILKSGGSQTPQNLLAKHNIDILSNKFYEDGLKVVEKMVQEFESLI